MPPHEHAAPGRRVLALWRRLRRLPGGRWLFHRILYGMVPYSGSTGARVVRLEPGRAELRLPDRRRVRNHLRSVHAVALANVGELASGRALLTDLPPGLRAIPVRLEIDFVKKARGSLTVRSQPEPPPTPPPDATAEHGVEAEILDSAGALVATTLVTWRVGRREDR